MLLTCLYSMKMFLKMLEGDVYGNTDNRGLEEGHSTEGVVALAATRLLAMAYSTLYRVCILDWNWDTQEGISFDTFLSSRNGVVYLIFCGGMRS